MEKTNFYTTEREGWRPYFRENEGFSGKTLHEVLELAGLNFKVLKVPTYFRIPGSDTWNTSKGFSTIREDTGAELGFGFSGGLDEDGRVNESGYRVVQHEEALGKIFQDVMDLETSAHVVNAIGFDNGARVAITFRLPDEYKINPDDKVGLYLNFFNSFDGGGGGIGASWFHLRPVCINTFRLARSKGTNGYFTRHTRNVNNRLELNAAQVLGLVRKEAEQTAKIFRAFAQKEADSDIVNQFLHHMWPDTNTGNQGPSNRREELLMNIVNGELVDSNNLTYWDLFNGVTKIANWKRQSRENDSEQFQYAQFGTGAAHMNKAYNWLMEALEK